MKKKVLASLLCASMVATMFAGCGSSNGNGTEKADKKAGGKETITVMGPAEDLDDAQGAWLKTECEAFAKANPDFSTSSSSMLHHLSQTQRMLLQRILRQQLMFTCLQTISLSH